MPHLEEILVVLRKELEDSRIRVTRAACKLAERHGPHGLTGVYLPENSEEVAEFVVCIRAHNIVLKKYGELLERLDVSR